MGHRILYIPKPISGIPIPYYHSTGGIATGNGASISVPYPEGIEEGDMLILHVLTKSGTMKINQPSGWFATYGGNIGSVVAFVNYRKFTDGTETGNLTVTFTTSEQRGIIMYLYKHANTGLNHGISLINNANSGSIAGFAADTDQLQSAAMYVNTQTSVSVSGTGWIENSNLSTPDNGGFTFVNATYAFNSSETAPTVSFSLGTNSYGIVHRALMKHTP